MSEACCGTIKDLDGVHYEISKEDEMLYQEYVQKMNFNKMKVYPMCFLRLIRKKKTVELHNKCLLCMHVRARVDWGESKVWCTLASGYEIGNESHAD
jgi:hypothetical protein